MSACAVRAIQTLQLELNKSFGGDVKSSFLSVSDVHLLLYNKYHLFIYKWIVHMYTIDFFMYTEKDKGVLCLTDVQD